jgi:primosomal protein N' (replication factor Y) (superfamily II helicase)
MAVVYFYHCAAKRLIFPGYLLMAIAAECQQKLGAIAEILGPAPATIMRVAQRYRWQIVIKFASQSQLYPDLRYLKQYCPTGVSFSIDVDPLFIE